MLKIVFESFKFNFYWLIEYRMNFLFQMFGMFFWDIVSIVIWVFMFNKVTVVGWIDFDWMLLLYECVLLVYVFSNIFFAWWRDIWPSVLNWNLDIYLLLPKRPLFIILSSRTYAWLYWDVLMALVLPFFIKYMTLIIFFKYLYLTFIASFTLTWILIFFSSLAFYIWSSANLTKTFFELLMWPPHYPPKIFDWTFLKIIFLTIIPVYYIFFLPFELIMNFDIQKMVILHLAAIFFFWLWYFTFYNGLKKYESWNLLNTNI